MPKINMYDKVVYPCQSPEIEEFTTVVYKNGSGGYQCRSDDMIPRSRNELVGNDELQLFQLCQHL